MSTTYIPEEGGGGGGSGTVTSVNVSGGTTGLTTSGGPVTGSGTIVLSGVLALANGGTGQSNQQAALNSLTNIGAATAGDVLTFTGGNAQFAAPVAVTPTGAANTFSYFNPVGDLDSIPGWNTAATPIDGSSNVQLSYQPNNLSGFPIGFNWNINVDPLQDSPNDGLAIHSFNANLDSASTGFDLGTNGDAAHLIAGGLSYQGNGGVYGRLRGINLFNPLGNSTDPFSFEGFNGSSIGVDVRANTTIDGSVTGYDFNLNVNAASISTSNFAMTLLADFSQIPIDLYGYQGLIIQPTIDTIKNNSNFTGINMNPVITDMEGNAGFQGINLGGQVTNQSATGGYQGININPDIVHLTQNSAAINIFGQTTDGTADWSGINISDSSISTSGIVRGLQIAVAQDPTHYAIQSTGHCELNVGFDVLSAQTQQYGHVIGGEVRIPNGTAVTGTDVLANNMAFGVNTGDATSTWTQASPVGLTTLGFVGQIIGDGDIIGSINFCLNGYNPVVNGTIDRVNNFAALCIPNSGTGTITEGVLYYGDGPFGIAATSMWGLRIEDSTSAGIENYLTKLAIGDMASKKVANASVGLELDSTTKAVLFPRMDTTQRLALTALAGMQVYDTTLNQMAYYNGTIWILF